MWLARGSEPESKEDHKKAWDDIWRAYNSEGFEFPSDIEEQGKAEAETIKSMQG